MSDASLPGAHGQSAAFRPVAAPACCQRPARALATEPAAERDPLPIAVIGAGPVGLAAAAHLARRGLSFLVLEQGPDAGRALRAWGHVRVFSPWRYNLDSAATALLGETGWQAPDAEALPTGAEIVRDYLQPLAAHPAIAPHVRYGAQVMRVLREGFDKVTTPGRAAAPFLLRWRDAEGSAHSARARAVLDASGTWFSPNPMGVSGEAVPGEEEAGACIQHGIPDVLGARRADYAGRRVLVVGSGHSAMNVVLDLLRLQEAEPRTRIAWAMRRDRTAQLAGGGLNDQLPARGALGLAARKALQSGRLDVLVPFAAERIESTGEGLHVAAHCGGRPVDFHVDRIVVATGFRPDWSALRELRVAADPVLESPPALAPLIDPNVHSCGTVPPPGVAELAQPERGFYIVGSKSYGRAPTFLMATGYEQVRSVVADLAGDHEAARAVHLVLPETGVCGAGLAAGQTGGADSAADTESACCGGPAPAGVDACCAQDAEARSGGAAGCGCGEVR